VILSISLAAMELPAAPGHCGRNAGAFGWKSVRPLGKTIE
jgi:hypothetical protein